MPVMAKEVGDSVIAFNIKFLKTLSDKSNVRLYFYEPSRAIAVEYLEPTRNVITPTEKKVVEPAVIVADTDEVKGLKEELRIADMVIKELRAKYEPSVPVKIAPAIKMVDYSEKAIALFGDTKPYKELIKSKFFGRFSTRLKNGEVLCAGWIVSKRYLKEVELWLEA